MESKVLLVEPDDSAMAGLNFGSLWRLEPAALEIIANSVPEHKVMIVDLRLDSNPIEHYLKEFKPDIVGITGVTALHHQMNSIITKAKRAGAFTVAGGPHASFRYEYFNDLDAAVVGEGEESFRKLVQALDEGKSLSQVPSLAWRSGKGWVKNKQKPSSLWCVPRRCLAQNYNYEIFGCPVVAVETTRGCPHRCTFCVTPTLFQRRYHKMNPERVASVIAERPEALVFFLDADFMASRDHVIALFGELKKRRLNKKYWVNMRVDEICNNEDIVRLWSRIGLAFALIGIEGHTNSQLAYFRKETSLDINKSAIRILNSAGIISIGTFIFDPSWDKSEINSAVSYLRGLKCDARFLSVLTPFPGTEIEKDYEITRDYDYWDVLHAVTPTRLAWHEFQQQFGLASKKILNLRERLQLAFKLRSKGIPLSAMVKLFVYMTKYDKVIARRC